MRADCLQGDGDRDRKFFRAVQPAERSELRSEAHALKGIAANLSATGLFEAAKVLERMGAESRMAAAEGAWRQLSVEASLVIEVLRRRNPETIASAS